MANSGLPPGIKARYFKGQVDVNFIVRNWKALNETPIKKAGLLIRTIMRGSIKRVRWSKRKGAFSTKVSPPGHPPYARYGIRPGGQKTPSSSIPFKKILSIPFMHGGGGKYKHAGPKAVIGHVKLPYKQQDPRHTPMEAHEFGRRVRVPRFKPPPRRRARTEKQRKAAARLFRQGKIKSKPRPQQAWRPFASRSVKMPQRAFAFPALQKGKGRIGNFWKDRIKKGRVKSSPIKI